MTYTYQQMYDAVDAKAWEQGMAGMTYNELVEFCRVELVKLGMDRTEGAVQVASTAHRIAGEYARR